MPIYFSSGLGAAPSECEQWARASYHFEAFEGVRQRAGELLANAPRRPTDPRGWLTPGGLTIEQAIPFLEQVSALFADASALLNLPRFFLVPAPFRYFRYPSAARSVGGKIVSGVELGTAPWDILTGEFYPAGTATWSKIMSWWRAALIAPGGGAIFPYVALGPQSDGVVHAPPTWFCFEPFRKVHWQVWGQPYAATVPENIRTWFDTLRAHDTRFTPQCGAQYKQRGWNTCRHMAKVQVPFSLYTPKYEDCQGYRVPGAPSLTIWMGHIATVLWAMELLRGLMGETGEQKVKRAFGEWTAVLADFTRQLEEAGGTESVTTPSSSNVEELIAKYNTATQLVQTAGTATGNVYLMIAGAALSLFGLLGQEPGLMISARDVAAFFPGRALTIQYRGFLTSITPPLPYIVPPPASCGLLSETGEGSLDWLTLRRQATDDAKKNKKKPESDSSGAVWVGGGGLAALVLGYLFYRLGRK